MAEYYVDGVSGTNTNSGTNATVPRKTIDSGCDLLANGDILWVKASTTYKETVTPPGAGVSASPRTIKGYSSTPGDGGVVTVDGESTRADGFQSAYSYWQFHNLKVINHTDNGFDFAGPDGMAFYNCASNSNGDRGFFVDNYAVFHNCEANDNGVAGFYVDQYAIFNRCTALDNGTNGIRASAYGTVLSYCLVRGGSDAAVLGGTMPVLDHCTIDGNSEGAGLAVASMYYGIAVNNCIFVNCTTAIALSAAAYHIQVGGGNCFYNNTSNLQNWKGNDITETTSNPNFNGADDYTLAATSVCVGRGHDITGATSALDIGAYQLYTAAGTGSPGSSRIVLTS